MAETIERMRDGELQYKIEKGKILPRPLLPCEKVIFDWAKCVKDRVIITCDIVPVTGPLWNWTERALYIVTVRNKTGYFRLEEVTVHLQSVKAKDGKTIIEHEHGSPDVIMLPPIRPGASANTQNAVASWCNGSPVTPPRGGFTLVNYGGSFPGYDKIIANARITYKAVPYFEEMCQANEILVGT